MQFQIIFYNKFKRAVILSKTQNMEPWIMNTTWMKQQWTKLNDIKYQDLQATSLGLPLVLTLTATLDVTAQQTFRGM